MLKLEELKIKGAAPNWLTIEGLKTLEGSYLYEEETPTDMYRRIARAAARILRKPDLENKFYMYLFNGWLCPASPVLSNFGLDRGLPISCYSSYVNDSIDGIFSAVSEVAHMSKHGGGTSFYVSDIRGRGSPISGGGKSEGVVPWLKVFDSTTLAINQGGMRKGSAAGYLRIDHKDIEEFIYLRKPQADINRQCLNIHHGVCITDAFMESIIKGDAKNRDLWKILLKTRVYLGEPYIIFIDTVNKNNPECYKKNNLSVKGSNLCSEITLHLDDDHSFVCCLSSVNLTKYDEWKNTDLVETAIWFLDAIMQEFIDKTDGMKGLERARRFAIKSRALGLGVLGWHSFLQSKMIPFDSLMATNYNKVIFKQIREQAEKATADLAKEYGEPEWCKGFGRRNTHLIAPAPTVSNATISGNVSPSIEPLTGNSFTKKTAKGSFIQKNIYLEKLLIEKKQNTDDVWSLITQHAGSVQNLDFLTEKEKDIFKTAREIDQFAIINQAADRQTYIDQSQSLNLFFNPGVEPKLVHKLHLHAWKRGIKSLYYVRTGSSLKGDTASRGMNTEKEVEVKKSESSECKSCEG